MKKSTSRKVPPATPADDDEHDPTIYSMERNAQANAVLEKHAPGDDVEMVKATVKAATKARATEVSVTHLTLSDMARIDEQRRGGQPLPKPRRGSGGFSRITERFGLEAAPFQTALAEDPGAALSRRKATVADETWSLFPEYPFSICGLAVRVLTLTDFSALALAGSPVLFGGDIGALDLCIFLWRLSVDFAPGQSPARTAFFQVVQELPKEQAESELVDYLKLVFKDADGYGKPGFSPAKLSVPRAVVKIAGATGWSEQSILALPMPRVYQYLAEIDRPTTRKP